MKRRRHIPLLSLFLAPNGGSDLKCRHSDSLGAEKGGYATDCLSLAGRNMEEQVAF
jgi:hypothetical protein